MKALIPLLQQSVLVTGALALMIVGTACYLWASGHPVPQEMLTFLGIILAFFFGSKSEQKMGNTLAEAQSAKSK